MCINYNYIYYYYYSSTHFSFPPSSFPPPHHLLLYPSYSEWVPVTRHVLHRPIFLPLLLQLFLPCALQTQVKPSLLPICILMGCTNIPGTRPHCEGEKALHCRSAPLFGDGVHNQEVRIDHREGRDCEENRCCRETGQDVVSE